MYDHNNHVCNGFNSKERNKSQEHCLDLCTTDDSFVMATIQIPVKFLNYGDSCCFSEIKLMFYNFPFSIYCVPHLIFF